MNKLGLSIVLLGRVLQVLGQVAILLLIARFDGARGVGEYTLVLALASPVFLFTHFRVREYLSSSLASRDTWRRLFILQVVFGAGAIGILTLLIGFIYGGHYSVLMGALGLSKVVENVVVSANGVSARHGDLVQVSISSIGRALTNVSAVLVGLLSFGLWFGLVLTAVFWGVQFFIYERKGLIRQLQTDACKPSVGYLGIGALFALGGAAMLTAISPAIPRIVLENYEGVEALGVFAVVAYYVRIGSVFFQAVSQTTAAKISRLLERGEPGALVGVSVQLLGASLAVGLVGLVSLLLVGDWAIALAFGDDLRPSSPLLLGVGLAGIFVFGNTALSIVAVAITSARLLLFYTTISVIITFIASLVLIPSYGAVGAANVWAIGAAVQLFLIGGHVLYWGVRPSKPGSVNGG